MPQGSTSDIVNTSQEELCQFGERLNLNTSHPDIFAELWENGPTKGVSKGVFSSQIPPVAIEEFGGLVTSIPPEKLQPEFASDLFNVDFAEFGVASRAGLTQILQTAFRGTTNNPAVISGVVPYTLEPTTQLIAASQKLLVADFGGNLSVESDGTGVLQPIDTSQVLYLTRQYMNGTQAYNRAFLGFSTDLKVGSGGPAVYDATVFTNGIQTPVLDPVQIAPPQNIGLSAPGTATVQSGACTAAGQIGYAAGGSATSTTYYVQFTFAFNPAGYSGYGPGGTNGYGQETTASPEAQITVPANNHLQIWPPNAPTGANVTGIYISGTEGSSGSSGQEKLWQYQQSSVAITGPFTPLTSQPPPDISTLTQIGVNPGSLVGNIASGQRYGIVLYKTRTGTITAGCAPFTFTLPAGRAISITNLPIGPPQVVQRIIAFTVAGVGANSAGPYFYIGMQQTVNGVTETATIVNDNTSTASGAINFDDTFLAASTDVTSAARKVVLPLECGVMFSESTRRLVWWGEQNYPSLLRISEADDPGTYFGDTGFLQVSENDGQRVTAVFEFRNQIYAAKEHSLHVINPTTSSPATWEVRQRSNRVGICGPRAFDSTKTLVFFVHQSGAHYFDGSDPVLISDELLGPGPDRPGLWDRINWTYAHLIWVSVDPDNLVVRIGVPLDGATAPSHVLKCSFRGGWEKSLMYSTFTRKFHYHPGRRWSIDGIEATQAILVQRPKLQSGVIEDYRLATRQVLFAGTTGGISYLDPAADLDNGQPFSSYYVTGAASPKDLQQMARAGVNLLNFVQLNARGRGKLLVSARLNDGTEETISTVDLLDAPNDITLGPTFVQSERIAMRFANDPAVEGRWNLKSAYMFMRPSYGMRL